MAIIRPQFKNERGKMFLPHRIWTMVPWNQKPMCYQSTTSSCDNIKLLVYYSSHGLNTKILVRYSGYGLNNEPLDERTILDHLNTKLVCYSDPHCIYLLFVSIGLNNTLVFYPTLLWVLKTSCINTPWIISVNNSMYTMKVIPGPSSSVSCDYFPV